jgi:hypothetical protein
MFVLQRTILDCEQYYYGDLLYSNKYYLSKMIDNITFNTIITT